MALPAWHLLVAVTQVESHRSHRQTGAEESLNSRNDSTTSYQKSLDVEKKDSSPTQCLLDRSRSRVCCSSSSTASERQTDTWRGETVLNTFYTPRREKYVSFLQEVSERTGCKMNSQLFSQSRGLNRMIHWETCIKKYWHTDDVFYTALFFFRITLFLPSWQIHRYLPRLLVLQSHALSVQPVRSGVDLGRCDGNRSL